MAIAPRMEMRQGQGLVMTPQLQQAIKLLQFSNFELCEYVEQELERNPVLERVEDADSADDPQSEEPSTTESAETSELAINADAGDPNADSAIDA